MNTTLLLQQLVNGIAVGSVYAIFALGYTLVFSILRVINFAHGAVFTLGAYFTYMLIGSKFGFNGLFANAQFPLALPFPIAMLVGGILAGLCGVLVERIAFRPLRRKGADSLLALVASLGMAIAIVNLIQYFVGAEVYSYPSDAFGKLPAALTIPLGSSKLVVRTIQVIIFSVSMVIMVLLTWFIQRTKIGKALQAVSEDITTASLLGINSDRLIMFTFFLSGLLGGIAGTLVGLNVSIKGPYLGIDFGLKGLAVIILGGLGDIPGTILGGFLIGIAESVLPAVLEVVLPSTTYLPGTQWVSYKDAIAFALLFLFLLLRPQGLLGRAAIQKV